VSYSIAQAALHSGLSIDTLRYYERIGIVDPPQRDSGGRRSYTEDELAWLVFLTRLRTTGMPIRQMHDYAEQRRLGDVGAGRRKEILLERRDAVRTHIAELQTCLEILDHKIDNYQSIERNLPALAEPAAREASA
jgi:DNA-binding transcriptional MerR regulator